MTSIFGTEANDTLTAGSFGNRLYGRGGDDTLTGGAGNDFVFAGRGDDTINVTAGGDALYGGEGDDTYVARNITGHFIYGVYEGEDAGYDVLILGVDHWRAVSPDNVEEVRIEAEVETFVGNAQANVIDASAAPGRITVLAGAGDDRVTGTSGNDVIDGGRGADAMAGGAGWDTYIVDDAGDTVTETAFGGTADAVFASVSYTVPQHVEVLVLEGGARRGSADAGMQTIIGNGGRNALSGGADADQLLGGGGRDRLDGGTGNDLLTGGAGRDKLLGGLGADTFIWTAAAETGAGRKAADRILDLDAGDTIDLTAVDANAVLPDEQGFVFVGGSAFSGVAGELRHEDRWLEGDRDGDGQADFRIFTGDAAAGVVEDALLL